MSLFQQVLPRGDCALIQHRHFRLTSGYTCNVFWVAFLLPPFQAPHAKNSDAPSDKRVDRLMDKYVGGTRATPVKVDNLLAVPAERRYEDGVAELDVSRHCAAIRAIEKRPQPRLFDDEDALLSCRLVEWRHRDA